MVIRRSKIQTAFPEEDDINSLSLIGRYLTWKEASKHIMDSKLEESHVLDQRDIIEQGFKDQSSKNQGEKTG